MRSGRGAVAARKRRASRDRKDLGRRPQAAENRGALLRDPVVTLALGFISGIVSGALLVTLTPGLTRMGTSLSERLFPPRALPAFEILASPPSDPNVRMVVANDGDERTVLTGVEVCSAVGMKDVYDHRAMRRGNKAPDAVTVSEPIDFQTLVSLINRAANSGWVVRCLPAKAERLRLVSGDRGIEPRSSAELIFAPPPGIELQSFEGASGAMESDYAGNAWCGVTAMFSTGETLSRIYFCKTSWDEPGITVGDLETLLGGAPPKRP